MFGPVASTGMLAGPILGAVFVTYLSWRWIFFVNVPIGIVVLLATLRYIPRSTSTKASRFDVRGLVLVATFLLAAMLAVTMLGEGKASLVAPSVLAPTALAVVLGSLLARHLRHEPEAFIPLRLLRGRGLGIVNLENVLTGAVSFGVTSLVPLYAENRYGLDVLNAGTLLAARALGSAVVGAVAAMALRRTGYRWPMAIGFSLLAIGLWITGAAPPFGLTTYAWLTIGAVFGGLGTGTAQPAARNACIQLATEDAAAITGLRNMCIFIGVIISVTVTTAILNRASDPGLAQAHVMWALAGVIMLVMVPCAFLVPEHKGNW
jgi:MFS family permease